MLLKNTDNVVKLTTQQTFLMLQDFKGIFYVVFTITCIKKNKTAPHVKADPFNKVSDPKPTTIRQ